MSQVPLVIKLGGAVLSCTETLEKLFSAINAYQENSHRPLMLVHGGGYLVDDLMAKLQLPTVKKQGLRVTPSEQIPVIAGALAGTANKLLQGQAIKSGVKAVGLSLADGGLCEVSQLDPELGSVGNAKPGNGTLVSQIMASGYMPIISSIGLDAQGELMNVNADQAAVAVAAAVDGELVLLSDVSGVLDGKGHLIDALTEAEAESLIEQAVITDGMIVKVRAAFDAAKALGRPIEVASWRYPEKLTALFDGQSIGTKFTL
ncbi:acetylglutamate kinase [Photobacterium leiognathi]|uniref:Acetylglutamate kinase n=3 Tax=Photobacterium leiognathi TaxID=553611 RepID=A0A0U1P8S2_PHOLE|nr:acetylglutamate kinase [Photobacterium leiognathi]KJF90845.1 acetylglutamate kinase [Photobacterium leiognathi]KJF99675.1 acetylglutamate kinase [Photobacterium leiognathi]KPA53590.1 acetylglutamate kinase [Photobacterium leiognathi subsp. mandapamensis]PSV12514.1 acetylglutamate kinase [Photobacterium leiognathi subsp. mandapamensis]PSV83104.1 acetylglutamate kinase [Photobacterium leiognathi]